MKKLLFVSSPEISGAPATASARILIVEDQWVTAQGLKENLENLGHEVTGMAASGEEAMRLTAERRPDLVLMDINLKGDMDGIDTARRLKSLEIPIICLTAYADDQTLERAKLVEPFGYILKPFEVRELRSAVEIALYKSQAEKRLLHLNLVLRAIRSISQLIVQEKELSQLIERACQLLTESRGYHSAWIALVDGDGRVGATAMAGSYGDRQVLPGLEQGKLPPCGREALEQASLVVVEDLTISCADCFWWSEREEAGALVTRLAHQDSVYGLLGVQLPAALTRDEEELILFRELASDLSFALYKIDLEKREQQALMALESSEAKYRQIVETANEGIWFINENFLTTFVNPQMAALLDCLPEEVLGRPVTDFMFPEDQVDHQDKMTQRRYGQCGLYERRLRTRKGREVWTLVSGTPVLDEEGCFKGSFGMFTDITERKRADEALVRAKDEWELTFDSVPEMIAILDREKTIVNLNQPMAAALGVTKEQARGRKCHDLVHGLMSAPKFCPFVHLLEDKQAHSLQVFEEKLGVFLQISVSPLFDREENLLGCVHTKLQSTDN